MGHESLSFDFVDLGEPEDIEDVLETLAPAAQTHEGELIPMELPDPERHRHPEATWLPIANPSRFVASFLLEPTHAVLEDREAVEDYET